MITEDLKKLFGMARITAFALLSAVLIYWAIAYITLSHNTAPPSRTNISYIRYLFYFMSLGGVCMATVLRKLLLSMKSNSLISQRLFGCHIAVFTFCEVPGIYGLTVCLISKNLNDFYPFGALALASMMVFWPKWDEWERISNQTARGLNG